MPDPSGGWSRSDASNRCSSEHTHIPVSAELYPGGRLPANSRTYDPFVALTAAAARRRILLATGICLVIERDPIVTAKEVASIDRLSGGRFYRRRRRLEHRGDGEPRDRPAHSLSGSRGDEGDLDGG
jgi:hypothetical protein